MAKMYDASNVRDAFFNNTINLLTAIREHLLKNRNVDDTAALINGVIETLLKAQELPVEAVEVVLSNSKCRILPFKREED